MRSYEFLANVGLFVIRRLIELIWWGFVIMTGVVAANYFLGYRFLEVL